MKRLIAIAGIFAFVCGTSTPLEAEDATTVLLDRLDKGDCTPSSLTDAIWTITTGPVDAHGELNWGDQLVFEQAISSLSFGSDGTFSYNDQSAFRVWKNGVEWKSAEGWNGECVRTANLVIYVITGKVFLDGCLHELAFGRLDHDDSLSNRIEVIFEHAEDRIACADRHGRAVRHPGHAHGSND